MSGFRLLRLTPDLDVDLESFSCGVEEYDEWLRRSARAAVRSRSASVYVLVGDDKRRVVGYFSLSPTQVARRDVPASQHRQLMRTVPGYLIAKLAVDRGLQAGWRRDNGLASLGASMSEELVVAALSQVVAASRRGAGQVVVVDADGEDLVPFYERCGFVRAEVGGMRLFMKVATAVRYLGQT